MNQNDSKSLWNYTLSPGWSQAEVEVFRLALMKLGMGRWSAIVSSGALPGKTVGQLNNQMQRMIGQQSTNEFQGLHIDPRVVFQANAQKDGVRKNGCLINTGMNPTREGVRKKRAENKEKWGLSQVEIDSVVIPTLAIEERPSAATLTDKQRIALLGRLKELQIELDYERKKLKPAADVAAT